MKKIGKKIIFENMYEFKKFIRKVVNEAFNVGLKKIDFDNYRDELKNDEDYIELKNEGGDIFKKLAWNTIDYMHRIVEYAYCVYLFAEYFRDKVTLKDPEAENVLNNLRKLYVSKNYEDFIEYYKSSAIQEIVFNSLIDDEDYIILLYCLYNGEDKVFNVYNENKLENRGGKYKKLF